MAVTAPRFARAVVFHAPRDLRIEDVPLPAVAAGDLLLRITACGLCPGEVMDWYVARKAPVPLGHEAVGEVVQAGAGAPYRTGDRVFVHHHAPCLACRACRRGDYVQCAAWRPRRLIPGGLATYAVANARAVAHDTLVVPPEVSDEVATFIEPLACVVKSLRRAAPRRGDRVLVLGAGVMGLLHLMLVRARYEPSQVIAADRVPARLEAAARYADAVVDAGSVPLADGIREVSGGDGADVVVVGPGTVDALNAAMACTAPGGTLVVFTPAPPDARWPLPVHDVFFREITVVPSYSAGPPDTREALALLRAGLPVETLITHRLSLAEAAHGYDLVRAAGPALKVIVRPLA
ncbi:MAG: alcohol dehydrogenase catalytic domain-containing protein [Armatimonadota bacterium]|nr:alcohol dehydrogenase catalytic domain-containing protein [Armatimonadota bacterium]